MNGLKLKGGQASTGPHEINHKHDTITRQRKRQAIRKKEFARLSREFGGSTARGGHYWPEGMSRRVARQIARDAA